MAGTQKQGRQADLLFRTTNAAMMTALIFLFTMFVKLPTAVGYIHLGDAFLLLYAAVTADPLALLAGALGEGLADLAGGYYQYLPATVLIKVLIALPVLLAAKKEKAAGHRTTCCSLRVFLTALPSILITLGGYFIVDYLLAGAYAFPALGTNAVQAVGSLVVFALLASVIDRSPFQKYIA